MAWIGKNIFYIRKRRERSEGTNGQVSKFPMLAIIRWRDSVLECAQPSAAFAVSQPIIFAHQTGVILPTMLPLLVSLRDRKLIHPICLPCEIGFNVPGVYEKCGTWP